MRKLELIGEVSSLRNDADNGRSRRKMDETLLRSEPHRNREALWPSALCVVVIVAASDDEYTLILRTLR